MMILRYCVVFECVCYSMNGETGMSHAERRAQLEAANKVVFTFYFLRRAQLKAPKKVVFTLSIFKKSSA